MSDINVSAAPAVVAWTRDDSDESLCFPRVDHAVRLTCTIRLDAVSRSAFVLLRFPVDLKAFARRQSLFLHIYPERVRELSDAAPTPVPNAVPVLLSTHVALHFQLTQPPVIVVPPKLLEPKNSTSAVALDMLRQLAPMTSFTIYLPVASLSPTLARSLCEKVRNGGLHSLASLANVSRLYTGLGGVAIDGGEFSLAVADREASTASPPSYDELAPTPPAEPSKKRKISEQAKPADEKELLLQEVCKRVMDKVRGEISDQVRDMEARILARVDERLAEQAEEYEDKLHWKSEDMAHETHELIDLRIDDQLANIKDELNSFVQDEIKDAEDRIKDHISVSNVSLVFNN